MCSNVEDDQCREDEMKSYLEREGLAVRPVVLDQADEAEDEAYDTMPDSASVAQPDDAPDPGCDVLGFGSVRLGLSEPASPDPNSEDISGDELPALSPGGSSVMESEPDESVTTSGEQENLETKCSIVSPDDDPSVLLDNPTAAAVAKVLISMVIDEVPIVQSAESEARTHVEPIIHATTEELPDADSPVAMEVVSVDTPLTTERSLTPPGMWPCKVPGCEAGPFRAKWQLTYVLSVISCIVMVC